MPYRSAEFVRRYPWVSQQFLDGIPGVLVWISFGLTIVLSLYAPRLMLWIAASLALYTASRFALTAWGNARGLRLIREWERRDWNAFYEQQSSEQSSALSDVQHIVIITAYRETLPLLQRTLCALAEQSCAEQQVHVVLALEERDPDHQQTGAALTDAHAQQFASFLVTIHPADLPGEMRVKSANLRHAVAEAYRELIVKRGFNLDHCLVTTMDADIRWHSRHFEALTTIFALHTARYHTLWQAPIRYHGNIWEIHPWLRIVNAYSTAFELGTLAQPNWLNLPISSYSVSLRLLHEIDSYDPDVIADEWHLFFKAYFAKYGTVTCDALYLPFIADATDGPDLVAEFRERYLQTLRHAWGSKEVGYVLAQSIATPQTPLWPKLRYLGRASHDVLLAGAGWVFLTLGAQVPILLHRDMLPPALNPWDEVPFGFDQMVTDLLREPVWAVLLLCGGVVLSLAVAVWWLDVRERPSRIAPMSLRERIAAALSIPLMPILTLILLAIPAIQAQTMLLLGIPLQFRVSRKGIARPDRPN